MGVDVGFGKSESFQGFKFLDITRNGLLNSLLNKITIYLLTHQLLKHLEMCTDSHPTFSGPDTEQVHQLIQRLQDPEKYRS